jgi:uncharacterized protein (TIGR03663 family)
MIALTGSLFLFAPLLWRKYFHPATLIALTGFIALSPTLIYWSRFLSHDFLFLLSLLIVLYSVTLARPSHGIVLALVGTTLQFCIKANAYMVLAILLTWIILEIIILGCQGKQNESLLWRGVNVLRNHPRSLLIGLGLSVLIYCYLYTGGFRYSEGILDGLYRKSLVYWANQHAHERLGGPFMYPFFVLSWYEILFICALGLQIIHFFWRSPRFIKISASILMAIAFVCSFFVTAEALTHNPISSFLKMRIPIDVIGLPFMVFMSVAVSFVHLFRQERALAFFAWFFWTSFFSYSFVGEKVPWLASYPLTAGFVYLALYFNFILDRSWNSRWRPILISLAILAFSWNLWISILTNHLRMGAGSEILAQVQTAKEFENSILSIREKMEMSPDWSNPTFYASDDFVWPVAWHFHNHPGYSFYLPASRKLSEFDYVILRTGDPAGRSLLETHVPKNIPFRLWWVPSYDRMTPLNFLRYTLFHEPWNPTGTYESVLYTRKELVSP